MFLMKFILLNFNLYIQLLKNVYLALIDEYQKVDTVQIHLQSIKTTQISCY